MLVIAGGILLAVAVLSVLGAAARAPKQVAGMVAEDRALRERAAAGDKDAAAQVETGENIGRVMLILILLGIAGTMVWIVISES